MNPEVSVVICVKNGEKYIGNCIESILNQTFRDFEIIIVDDLSNDTTVEIINRFKDERINCFKNKQWTGTSKTRNKGIKHANGKFVFMTDADCTVYSDWIEEGLKSFEKGYIGVEGRVFYVSENYESALSDYVMENKEGGNYMTGNVAYRKDVLNAVGGLNEEIKYFSDRELGLKILKLGKVIFNENMRVTHPLVVLEPKAFLRLASRIEDRPYLFKKFGDKALVTWRFLKWYNLVKIFFPEMVLMSFFVNRLRRKQDYVLLPYTYAFAVLERYHIWKSSAKNRIFLI